LSRALRTVESRSCWEDLVGGKSEYSSRKQKMKRFSLILRRGQSFEVFSAPMARCSQMQIRCRRIGKEKWWGVGGSRG
jgi:hypothetical protein